MQHMGFHSSIATGQVAGRLGMTEGVHSPLLYMHRNRGSIAFVWFAQGSFTGEFMPSLGFTAQRRVTDSSRRMSPRQGPSCHVRTACLCFLRKGLLSSLEIIAFLKTSSLHLISVPNIVV